MLLNHRLPGWGWLAFWLLVVGSSLVFCVGAAADPVGVVSRVKVLSDKVEDVSSMEAWKRSFIKAGMSDREKALAVWETVVKFRHQDNPPNEYLQGEDNVHDPIKTFNVYGYGMCCCAACNVEALARHAGLPARGRIIRAHSVPEVQWDGAWHLLDASLINYVPKPDGKLAGVDEIMAGLKAWYEKNPGYKNNDGKLRQFMTNGGWKKGPAILANCPFYDNNGWLPAATHGWYSTMQEYDGSANGIYEYGYSQGYQVNIQLRRGERLTRNWGHRGLHVNLAEGANVGCLNGRVGQGDLRYASKYDDRAPGRIGNGALEYNVPLANGEFRYAALAAENLGATADDGAAPAVHVKDAAKPGVLVLRMPSSYVYLSGQLNFKAAVAAGGSIAVSFSDNNGLDWREVATVDRSGRRSIDLGPLVYRRYDYRLKFVMQGKGTGLDRLQLLHDIQHSQRALPALGKGANAISFSAGPQEGTITIEGGTNPENKSKQLVTADFHPRFNGVKEHLLRLEGGKGDVTFPVETPGDLLRLRFGCHYRARDARDGWDMQVSFDDGQTFKTYDRCAGPTVGDCKYITVDDVPAGARAALVRWSGAQRNTTCMFAYRIDADYDQPHGGFQPVKVTYCWLENGRVQRDVHVAEKPAETYTINCAAEPVMQSITLELAE